jgi:hypothetical protein
MKASSGGAAVTQRRRPPIFGPEPWQERGGRSWCHWDLWLCMVAVLDHGEDLGGVERDLVDTLSGNLSQRRSAEQKLSHLWSLRERLDDAGLLPADLVDDETVDDKRIVAKARRKVDSRSIDGRALTGAMIDTPRVRLQRRARYGSWDALPVTPATFYGKFRAAVEIKSFIAKGRTFKKVQQLSDRLQNLDGPRRSPHERIALYRAFHTAGLELADRADDSYGVIDEMRSDAWETYLTLDWNAAGVAPDVYWRDICELVVWEPYGMGFENETHAFAHASGAHAPAIAAHLHDLETELRAVHLTYEADQAREQLAWLHIATGASDRFVETATLLGSSHWRPVDAMARAALEAGDRDLAVAVFAAADQPGWHRDHLRRRCLQLTGADHAGGSRHLRVVQ